MSSLKMTFSLTSLFLIFALIFSVMPVLAHTTPAHTDPHPTVSITAAPDSEYTATDVKARGNFKVKIAFSVDGSTDSSQFTTDVLEANDLTFSGFDRDGVSVGSPATIKSGVTFADTRVAANKHEWVVPLDITDPTLRTLRLTVGPNVVTGNIQASLQSNESAFVDLTDLPIVSDRTVDVTVAPVTTTPAKNDYVVTFKFDGTTTVPGFLVTGNEKAQLIVNPASFKAGLPAPVESTETNMQNLYTLAVNLTFDVQSVTISVDPKFAKATEDKVSSVQIPPIVPPAAPTQADPTVSIMVDMLDTTARTFRVDITSTPGAMSDGSTPKAQPVAHGNLEVKDASGVVVTTNVEEQDTSTNSTTGVSRYVAILKYGLASNAPVSVGLKATFKTANTVTPVRFDGGTTPQPGAPGMPTGLTANANQATNTVALSWTAPTTGTVTGYTITQTGAAAMTYTVATTSFTTSALAAGTYMFTVTASNASGSGSPSASVSVTIDEDVIVAMPITVEAKTKNLNRRGTSLNEFSIGPDQKSFELTITSSVHPDSAIDIHHSNRDLDRSRYNYTLNTGTPTSWTLRIAVSNPNPVKSFYIELHESNPTYQLVTPDLRDAKIMAPIHSFWVKVDNEGPVLDNRNVYPEHVIPLEGGPFQIRMIFDEKLKATPVAADFSIKNGTISDIRYISVDASGRSSYLATITPNAGVGPLHATKKKVELRLKPGLLDQYDNPGLGRTETQDPNGNFEIRKATTAAPTPPAPGDIDGTKKVVDATITQVTLTGVIAANGFATIGAVDLPNLAEFFRVGGSITLTDAEAIKKDHPPKTVVISEILWGLDLGAPLAMQNKQQFIELYNTSADNIDLKDWMLEFNQSPTAPANDVDQVSNVARAGWTVDIGQSGRYTGTSNEVSGSTVLPINIVSMYRNIDYKKVEKVKADGTADPSRAEQLKGVPDGNAKGSWKASTRAATRVGIYESKGAKHSAETFKPRTATKPARNLFIINEVGNGSGDTNDWVEIRNLDSNEKSLKNYHLSAVLKVGTDTPLVNFKDKEIKVPGNGVILIANTSPEDTDLAAGRNAAIHEDDQVLTGVDSVYYVDSNLKLPDDGKFNLILRSAHDKLGKAEAVMDVIGGQVYTHDATGTSAWPLVATGAPHEDVVEANGRDLKAGYVYIRKDAAGGISEHDLGRAGYTGVGYDRAAAKSDANGGTPGFDNGALKDKVAGLTTGEITISEIMSDVGEGRQNLPQWIELYNSSMTEAVNLNGWKLYIENAANGDGTLETNTFSATITLGAVTVSPNQTVLIASSSGRVSDPDHFPSTRVINLWTTKAHRVALDMTRRTDAVLSTAGFNIMLKDKENKLVDEAGNLDGNRRTRDEPAWALPMGEDDGRRSSIIRVYDEGVEVSGTKAEAWTSADATNLAFAISQTYYGDPNDFGTPGFRGGGPLPVSLSKFRPERMKDTGEIVVRWITESELNNAGFNILRSEKRNGEFTKVHYQAGQGTTTERTVYEWKDKTAKPNVVYYYQIQDVSLDGEVTPLRITHLRGNVTAAGKATTTWGEIKALQ